MLEPDQLKNSIPLHNLFASNLARLAARLTIEIFAKGAILFGGGDFEVRRSDVLICRNGHQSDVAAFLLVQRGFRAWVLRDGLRSLAQCA